jgi:hypothetical protein
VIVKMKKKESQMKNGKGRKKEGEPFDEMLT